MQEKIGTLSTDIDLKWTLGFLPAHWYLLMWYNRLLTWLNVWPQRRVPGQRRHGQCNMLLWHTRYQLLAKNLTSCISYLRLKKCCTSMRMLQQAILQFNGIFMELPTPLCECGQSAHVTAAGTKSSCRQTKLSPLSVQSFSSRAKSRLN